MLRNVNDFLDDLFLKPEFDEIRMGNYDLEEDDDEEEYDIHNVGSSRYKDKIKIIVKNDKDVTVWERMLEKDKPYEYKIMSPKDYRKFKKLQKEEEEEERYQLSQYDDYYEIDENTEVLSEDDFNRLLDNTNNIIESSKKIEKYNNKDKLSKKEKRFLKYFKKYEKKSKKKNPNKLSAYEILDSIADDVAEDWYREKGFKSKGRGKYKEKNVDTIITDKAERGKLLDILKDELRENIESDIDRELESFIGDEDYDKKCKSFKSMKKKGKSLSKDVVSQFII